MLCHVFIGILQILLFGDLIDVPPTTAHSNMRFNGQLIFLEIQVHSYLLLIRVKPPAPFGKTQYSLTDSQLKSRNQNLLCTKPATSKLKINKGRIVL
jgi:hypothetical protein